MASPQDTWQNSKINWRSRITRYGKIRADQVTPHPNNPRAHPIAQRQAVQASFDVLGQIAPIIINERNGYLVDGAERTWLALSQGDDTEIDAIWLDLSDEEHALALASFDWITQMATYDREALDSLLREVDTDNAALQSLLSELAEQNDLYFGDAPAPVEDVGPQISRADELQAIWQVKRGDVWTIGKHRLMCGDSTNADDVARLMGGVKADAVVTDPPYNLDMESWDNEFSLARLVDVIAPHFHGFMATFCQMPIMLQFAADLQSHNMIYRDCVVWLKRNSSTVATPLHRAYENILIYSSDKSSSYAEVKGFYTDVKLPLLDVGGISFEGIDRHIKDLQKAVRDGMKSPVHDGAFHNHAHGYMPKISDRSPEYVNFTNVWSFLPETKAMVGTGAGDHPTMKPVKALVRLCELLAKSNDIIIDPFTGSGTTLVACEQTGQRGFGMEISEAYCAVTLQRLADMGLTPTRESSTHEIEF